MQSTSYTGVFLSPSSIKFTEISSSQTTERSEEVSLKPNHLATLPINSLTHLLKNLNLKMPFSVGLSHEFIHLVCFPLKKKPSKRQQQLLCKSYARESASFYQSQVVPHKDGFNFFCLFIKKSLLNKLRNAFTSLNLKPTAVIAEPLLALAQLPKVEYISLILFVHKEQTLACLYAKREIFSYKQLPPLKNHAYFITCLKELINNTPALTDVWLTESPETAFLKTTLQNNFKALSIHVTQGDTTRTLAQGVLNGYF